MIDDEAADAYTLPGWPCRIVVTAGMMRALSDPERQVLLAHERAHASAFHYLSPPLPPPFGGLMNVPRPPRGPAPGRPRHRPGCPGIRSGTAPPR